MRGYTQLTHEQRYQPALMKPGHRQTETAAVVGVDKATLSREVRRNCGLRGYRPKQAHRLALARRCNKVQLRISERVWRHVEALIRKAWSPEQIVKCKTTLIVTR